MLRRGWHEGGWFPGYVPPQERTARGGFCFGGRALLPFVLRVVAGACVGRWTGQPRMPPQERLHEGLGGLGDCFTCPELGNDTETTQRGRGAVAVCFEGCCGSMCWPVDRPATHAAAGAAARGVRGIGGLFHMPGAWERHRDDTEGAGRCCRLF